MKLLLVLLVSGLQDVESRPPSPPEINLYGRAGMLRARYGIEFESSASIICRPASRAREVFAAVVVGECGPVAADLERIAGVLRLPEHPNVKPRLLRWAATSAGFDISVITDRYSPFKADGLLKRIASRMAACSVSVQAGGVSAAYVSEWYWKDGGLLAAMESAGQQRGLVLYQSEVGQEFMGFSASRMHKLGFRRPRITLDVMAGADPEAEASDETPEFFIAVAVLGAGTHLTVIGDDGDSLAEEELLLELFRRR
jgi:hypothetical protein